MFWDRVAGVYDLFVNIYNRKVHEELKRTVAAEIKTDDVVVAANVIHLLDEPVKALKELDRVCRPGGKIIIPTYMNKEKTGEASQFSKTVGKAGADFKQAFTLTSYKQFFCSMGYEDVTYHMIHGRVPCAVAVIIKKREEGSKDGSR